MSTASLLSESDLHGLVDGHLDVERRADALRRAAASPEDRARIEAWQTQNDLIRAAFAGCEREPVPSSLDLRAPPRLRCVPSAEPGIAAAPVASRGGRRVLAGAATFVLVAAGLAGSWCLAGLPREATGRSVEAELRGTADASLVAGTARALAFAPAAVSVAGPGAMPVQTIPDLSSAGFALTGAEVRSGSLVFRYQNAAADRVVVGTARAGTEASTAAPVLVGSVYTWHGNGTAYAIAGTVPPDRLLGIAVALRGEIQAE